MYHFEVGPGDLEDSLVVSYYRVRHVLSELGKSNDIRPIEDLASIASGTYVRDYVPASKGIPYLRVDNIRPFLANLNCEDLVFVDENDAAITPRATVSEGDVLLARTGTLGKACLALEPLVGSVMSQHVTRLHVSDSAIRPGYLAAFLNTSYGKVQLLQNAYGSTRPELTHSALGRVQIPILDDDFQERLSRETEEALREYYHAIAQMKRAIQIYESAIGFVEGNPEEERALRTFTVETIDRQIWVPRFYLPKSNDEVRRLESSFHCERLGKLANIQRGKGTRIAEYASEGVPFVRTTGLVNYGIDPFPDHYATMETYRNFGQPILRGDILVSIEGKIGQVSVLSDRDRCVYKNHIERVRSRTVLPPEVIFLYLSSQSGQLQIEMQKVVQSTIPGLAGRLRNILIPVRSKPANSEFDQEVGVAVNLVREAIRTRERSVSRLRQALSTLSDHFGMVHSSDT